MGMAKSTARKTTTKEYRETTRSYLFEIVPVSKPRLTRRDRWARRPIVLRWFTFKDKMISLAEKSGYKVASELDIEFHIAMPPSWSKRKRQLLLGKPHRQRPDIDNLVKAFLDALCEEDSYVCDIRARKFWSNTGYILIN